MFVHRNIYEMKIGNKLFKANDTKGIIEVYDKNGEIIGFQRGAADNFEDFQIKAHKFYNEIEKG